MSTPKIEAILLEFTHHTQKYILFSLEASSEEYLYIQNKTKSVRSILFGKHFADKIPQLIKNPQNACIECSLGLDISGGISIDGNEQVEFGISVEEANLIVDCLQTHIPSIKFEIPYFTRIDVHT